MRAWIVIGFLVVALGVAGSTRRNTESRQQATRRAEVSAPVSAAPRDSEEPPAPRIESTTPSLPLFEVGPEEDEAPPVKAEPAAAPPVAPRVEEAKPPVVKQLPKFPMTEARIERCRSFLKTMLWHERSALNQCYEDAQRRYPRLRRDFRLSLTLSGARYEPTTLESVEVGVPGYLPPQFDACVKRVVSDISLPYVTEKLTLSLPISAQPDEYESSSDNDDDDEQGDA